jgi:hypothetical protein
VRSHTHSYWEHGSKVKSTLGRVRVNWLGGKENSYKKRGEFLQEFLGQQEGVKCWSLKEAIVGMCGSCLELENA